MLPERKDLEGPKPHHRDRDDHLLKCTVLKDRKRSLQKLSTEFKTSENKTLSRITIARISNAGFVSRRCVKKPLLSQKNIKDWIKFLAEYGKFDSEWFSRVVVMNQEISCMLMLQRGVFKALVRNTIVNASLPQLSMEEEVSWCGEPFQLLVLVSCFTVKSQLMLWNTGEYCRKACFPQLFSKAGTMLFFNKTVLLPTLQRPWTSPSGSCFGPVRVQIWTL